MKCCGPRGAAETQMVQRCREPSAARSSSCPAVLPSPGTRQVCTPSPYLRTSLLVSVWHLPKADCRRQTVSQKIQSQAFECVPLDPSCVSGAVGTAGMDTVAFSCLPNSSRRRNMTGVFKKSLGMLHGSLYSCVMSTHLRHTTPLPQMNQV